MKEDDIFEVVSQFISNSLDDKFEIIKTPSYSDINNSKISPDIVIRLKSDDSVICAIEIGIINVDNVYKEKLSQRKRALHKLLDVTNALFAVLTDGIRCIVVKPVEGKADVSYAYNNLNGIIQEIQQYKDFILTKPKREQLLRQMIQQLTSSSKKIEQKLLDLMDNCPQSINFEGNSFSLDPSAEMAIIKQLLTNNDVYTYQHLYKYTSISSLMRNITENAESMCGLAVMNDKSECYFIEDLIFNLDKKNLSSRSAEEVKELNSYFINSLSTTDPMSDLTMWRLYGDDGQGVCIEYEVDKSILEGNSNFYLLPVDYTGSEAKKSEAVKVLSDLKRAKRVLGFKYTFTQTDIWKHFFKPKQFDVEHEVRLMYIKNEDDSKCIEKWIYNTKYSIVHPIILFNRNDNFYPLKVTKIILGPKFKESDTNKAQLRLLLDKNNWTDVKISSSEIEFYR